MLKLLKSLTLTLLSAAALSAQAVPTTEWSLFRYDIGPTSPSQCYEPGFYYQTSVPIGFKFCNFSTGVNSYVTLPTNGGPAGTPSSITLTNGTGLPLTTGVTGVLPTANGGTGSATLGPVLSQNVVKSLTLTQLQTLHSVGVEILPAVVGTMYVMGPCSLNLTYGSAAFTGGGAVSVGYGTTETSTPSPLTHGTIAATVFTAFSSSHGVVIIPAAVAVTATTSLSGVAVYMNATSADFAVGTGASGQLSCQYSAMTGVS